MSDDFGTINVRRGERAREIEVMRQHYRQHREALQRMIADAPTEYLAGEYQRLIGDIDRALVKLDELEGNRAATPAAAAAATALAAPPPLPPPPDLPRGRSDAFASHDLAEPPSIPDYAAEPRSRLPLILAAAIIGLALIGWLIWRASSDRGAGTAIVEERPAVATSTEAEPGTSASNDTIAAAGPQATGLAVMPVAHDYGTIRKGTRATRQYELSNTTDEPITVLVARSACRCLYYEHAPLIPPKGKENLTVTIDGARAKEGTLHEEIRISAKSDAAVGATIDVNATIR
jgi:hypothetical protein